MKYICPKAHLCVGVFDYWGFKYCTHQVAHKNSKSCVEKCYSSGVKVKRIPVQKAKKKESSR